jgi:hypothetical protein
LRLLREARNEIQCLTDRSDTYKQDLSLEESFIVRASPLFEEASQVYAISIDQFSEFWVSEDQRSRAQEYTSHQPENSIRLFVFSSIENAQRYRYILGSHYARYGKRGAVLLTSRASYRQFLASIDVEKVPELLERDFAILAFKDQSLPSKGYADDEYEYFEATLSRTKLVCEQLPRLQDYHRSFISTFEELRNLADGQSQAGIRKWQEEFKFDDSQGRSALSATFGIAAEADGLSQRPVYHILFLAATSPAPATVAHVEENVRDELERLLHRKTGERLVEDLWFGHRNEVLRNIEVVDGEYGGGNSYQIYSLAVSRLS